MKSAVTPLVLTPFVPFRCKSGKAGQALLAGGPGVHERAGQQGQKIARQNITCQWYSMFKGLSLSQLMCIGIVQWIVSGICPMEYHFCDFWCVVFCPESGRHSGLGSETLALDRAETVQRLAQ